MYSVETYVVEISPDPKVLRPTKVVLDNGLSVRLPDIPRTDDRTEL